MVKNTLLIRRITTIGTEVFKSLYNVNLTFMNQMFEVKTISYDLRNSNVLFQPKWQKVTYLKNTYKYYGTHIWNLLPNEIKTCTVFSLFIKVHSANAPCVMH